jgi:hypothetical protein
LLATIDTTAIVAIIKHLIAIGATERVVVTEFLRRFPDMSSALSAALQDAAAAAERQTARRS